MNKLLLKRGFDIVFSVIGLILFFLVIFFAWILSSIDTKNNGFFLQTRVGRHGKPFQIIKIRTMRPNALIQTTVTQASDTRITRLGFFLRKAKIDELPQLWNVLVGQMSFVGPRPDVTGYADQLIGKNRIILSVRPGITGPAQLYYKNEEDMLAIQNDPIKYNNEIIWPDKVKINRRYIENYSFLKDIYYIWKTIVGGNVEY